MTAKLKRCTCTLRNHSAREKKGRRFTEHHRVCSCGGACDCHFRHPDDPLFEPYIQ